MQLRRSRARSRAPATPDIIGAGHDALLLPALSSIATRDEMRPLAERLGSRFRCMLVDWPGFGSPVPAGQALSPDLLDRFLDEGVPPPAAQPLVGISAGHGAMYLVRDARRHPGRYDRLILVAPTWRGPLPTMTDGGRPGLCGAARRALEGPLAGPALYRLNLSRPVVGWMMRGHVYADRAKVTPALVEAKAAVARRPGGRFATAAFVSGGLDPVCSRAEFLALFAGALPPTLLLRPRGAPRRSALEMDALAQSGRVTVAEVDGALAPHEEHPDGVASAILSFLPSVSSGQSPTDVSTGVIGASDADP